MDKLQALLNEHKNKLWGGLYDIQLSNYNSTDIGLWEDVEGDIGNFIRMQSLSDLLFDTPFLSWLERRNPSNRYRCWGHCDGYKVDKCFYEYDEGLSDYHKINLCLLDTDSERITYITNNTF